MIKLYLQVARIVQYCTLSYMLYIPPGFYTQTRLNTHNIYKSIKSGCPLFSNNIHPLFPVVNYFFIFSAYLSPIFRYFSTSCIYFIVNLYLICTVYGVKQAGLVIRYYMSSLFCLLNATDVYIDYTRPLIILLILFFSLPPCQLIAFPDSVLQLLIRNTSVQYDRIPAFFIHMPAGIVVFS